MSKLTNSKQPTSEDTSFPGLFFTKNEGKQQVCYPKTSATNFYDNAYQNSLNSELRYFSSNTSQFAIEAVPDKGVVGGGEGGLPKKFFRLNF